MLNYMAVLYQNRRVCNLEPVIFVLIVLWPKPV